MGEVIDADADARRIRFRFSNGTETWIAVDEVEEVEPFSTTQTVLGIAALVGGTLVLLNAESSADVFGGSSVLGLAAIGGGFIYLGSGFQAGAARTHLERAGWQPEGSRSQAEH